MQTIDTCHEQTAGRAIDNFLTPGQQSATVVCISLETRSVAKQVSVAVGWNKIKILLMAQLKGLTAKFKPM